MVTSSDGLTHRPNVICSTEEGVDSFLVRPWARDNCRAQNSDDPIYRLLVTSCQHPRLLSLLFLSFTLCLSRKNGKHMSVPRISPAFFGSQVTATVIMSHYLLRPVTAGTNLGLFFPYACLSHLIVPSANQLLIYIYKRVMFPQLARSTSAFTRSSLLRSTRPLAFAMASRNYASTPAGIERIKVKNPVVEIDGDEMTRIIWKKIREEVCLSAFYLTDNMS